MLFISNVNVCTLIFLKKDNINKSKIGKQWQGKENNTMKYVNISLTGKAQDLQISFFSRAEKALLPTAPSLEGEGGQQGGGRGGYSVYTAPAHCTELWCGTAVFQECYEYKVAKFCTKITIFPTKQVLNLRALFLTEKP